MANTEATEKRKSAGPLQVTTRPGWWQSRQNVEAYVPVQCKRNFKVSDVFLSGEHTVGDSNGSRCRVFKMPPHRLVPGQFVAGKKCLHRIIVMMITIIIIIKHRCHHPFRQCHSHQNQHCQDWPSSCSSLQIARKKRRAGC